MKNSDREEDNGELKYNIQQHISCEGEVDEISREISRSFESSNNSTSVKLSNKLCFVVFSAKMKHFPCYFVLLVALLATAKCLEEFE